MMLLLEGVTTNNAHMAKGFWGFRTVPFLDLGDTCTDVYITTCYSIYIKST